MIMAAWCSAKPRARFHVPSSTVRASRNARRPVYPHRRSSPRRCLECALPGGGGRIAVYDVPRRLDRRARIGVELAEWLASAARCPDGICSAQLDYELREIPGRLAFIVDEIIRIRLTLDPLVDRPGEGVRARGVAH